MIYELQDIFVVRNKEDTEGGIGCAVNLVDKLGLFTTRQMNISCDKTHDQQQPTQGESNFRSSIIIKPSMYKRLELHMHILN